MACATTNAPISFTEATKDALSSHIRNTPSGRRVSRRDRDTLLEWLTKPDKRPSSQEEFSRRNYVRKTFSWNNAIQSLLAVSKKGGDKDRIVITTDMIADIVEEVHTNNGHAGWDATWKDVSSSYYGILRSDVILLLKQCQICSGDPSKRPKRSMDKGLDSPSPQPPLWDFTTESETRIEELLPELSAKDIC